MVWTPVPARSPTPRASGIVPRLHAVDWGEIASALAAHGWAKTPALLTPAECAALIDLWDDPRRFRSRVQMARFRFGEGEYRYFAEPLPPLVRDLRTAGYAHLAPLANRWMEALGDRRRFPPRLRDFLAACDAQGQTRPTPLLLRYEPGGWNALHQDLYGDVVFPLQLTCFLSRPGVDYGGGESLLVEQRPRAQSRGEVIVGQQGEVLVFPTSVRPVAGVRGVVRHQVRHGIGRVTRGLRWALGVIFHDAR
jgi:hypothetical protein